MTGLKARAIALQGIGYVPLLVALQGFAVINDEPHGFSGVVGRPGTGRPKTALQRQLEREDEELILFITAAIQTIS